MIASTIASGSGATTRAISVDEAIYNKPIGPENIVGNNPNSANI